MKTKLALVGAAALLTATAHALPQVISGNITTNTAWSMTASPDGYILDGLVFVTNNATLDIAPGTIIRGQPKTGDGDFDPGALIITRTGRIQARGTAASPIIFTTAAIDSGRAAGGPASGVPLNANGDLTPDKWTPANGVNQFLDQNPTTTPLAPIGPTGRRNSALWGGLVIAGNSRTNTLQDVDIPADGVRNPGEGFIEGLANIPLGVYGGGANPDLLDDSGVVKYVSLRHGGFELTTGRELNGLSLYAVGSGTTIDHIDVYCNSDDGVEVFGGTVNLSYLNINFCEDDGFDADQGHSGMVQYVYVAHGTEIAPGVLSANSSDPRGMELDGDDANENGAPITTNGLPRQDTRIYNATVQTNGQVGVQMRRGFGGMLVNSIIANGGAATTGIEIVDGVVAPSINTRDRYAAKELQIRNTTINGFAPASSSFSGFDPSANTGFAFDVFFPNTNNRTVSADMQPLTYANNGLNPRTGAGPGSPSPLATGSTQDATYVVSPALATSYKGAFDPAAANLWTFGWTAANKTNTAGIKPLAN